MSARSETVTLNDMWTAALSIIEEIDGREARLVAGGGMLPRFENARRAALRGVQHLIERVERSPAILTELKRLAEAERQAAEREASATETAQAAAE